MKKIKIEHPICENSEAGERRYLQKLKADQRMLQMFYSSFTQCSCFPFYLYSDLMFPQTDLYVSQQVDNADKE